jgi:Uma2 family endonuclease
MATSSHLLTWKEFEQHPDEQIEILEGELLTVPIPRAKHSIVAANIFEMLQPLNANQLGYGLCCVGYKLSEDPPTWIKLDVSFLKMERVRATEPDSYFLGAPELAVEIVSPSDTQGTLRRKVDLLLADGSLAVWVVYLEDRQVHVFLPEGTSFSRGINDVLTLPEMLPGWELPVAKIFED